MRIQKLFWISVFCLLTSGCTSDRTIEYHPDISSIPYYDNEHIMLPSDVRNQRAKPPYIAKLLQQYISNPASFNEKLLPVLITISDKTIVEETGEHQIVVVDQTQNSIVAVDCETMDTTMIATSGRGPGDVRFMRILAF